MSLRSVAMPKYRHHKGSGQAFVQLDGHRYYLGVYGSEQSEERYRRFLAENLTTRKAASVAPASPIDGLTVVELAALYLEFASGYYVKNGRPTTTMYGVKQIIGLLRDLYGTTAAADFGPSSLKAVRQRMVDVGLARETVNKRVDMIRGLFRWAVAEEHVPPSVLQGLQAVAGLRRGRTEAPETNGVQAVAAAVVDATLGHLGDVVADMVRFQRLTGARPDEVCSLRPMDVDRGGDVWIYRPASHKTQHHGRERIVYIGPKAQDVLRPYLLRPADAYCFSPQDSEAKRRAELRANRKTPLALGNRPGTNRRRKPKRTPGARYDANSYRRAIHRAVDKANEKIIKQNEKRPADEAIELLPKWAPNQLRHSAASEVRRQFGLEAAQVVLGHAKADVTQVYAERDATLGVSVARQIG